VDEAAWLALLGAENMTCWNPEQMLGAVRGQVGERKLRLFACACCRELLWQMLPEGSRRAIEVVERYADGQAGVEELRVAQAQAIADEAEEETEQAAAVASVAAMAAAVEGFEDHLTMICRNTWYGIDESAGLAAIEAAATECVLVRDVHGNPFRPLPPRRGKRRWDAQMRQWRGWNDGTVPRIAQGIYDERAFDRLPILADALLDIGCGKEDLIQHCRSAGPHVRGCWAVDLILGKS
jgi:hypothetical protein